MTKELEEAYRSLGYEINLTHFGKVSIDDVKSLMRAIYAKRARMAGLIEVVETELAACELEYARLLARSLTGEAAVSDRKTP